MVGGSLCASEREIDSSILGITVAGKWKPTFLHQEDPWGKQELSGRLHRGLQEENAPHVTI